MSSFVRTAHLSESKLAKYFVADKFLEIFLRFFVTIQEQQRSTNNGVANVNYRCNTY